MKNNLVIAILSAALLATAHADQFWSSGVNLIDGASIGTATDNDLVDTGATLVVTNGGNLLANQLVVGQAGSGTLELWPNSSITVATLLATNNTLAATNSFLNLNGGTLTTSNAPGAIAANILMATNTPLNINSTWNMLGGVNNTVSVQPAGTATKVFVGSSIPTTVTVSNAVWNLGNSAGLQSQLQIGTASAASGSSLIIQNGGVVTNLALNNGNSLPVGVNAGCSSNSIVITNGGVLHMTGAGAMALGNSSTASNNTVLVTGAGSVLNMNSHKFAVGNNSSSSGNILTVANGAVAANVYNFTMGNDSTTASAQNNQLVISNGGQCYIQSGSADSVVGYGTNAANNTILISGANSLLYNTNKSLYIGGNGVHGQNTYNNGVIVNGGTLQNPSTLYVGGATNCYSNYLIATNGGTVVGLGIIGSAPGDTNNFAQVGGNGGGTWNLNAGALIIGAAAATNNYVLVGSGGVLTNAATIAVGVAGSSGSKLYLNSGTIVARSANSTTITNGADGQIVVQSGGATFDDNGQSIAERVSIVEDPNSTGGSVTKLGSGTLTLTNANSFTGGLYIKAGRVVTQTSRQALGGNGYGQVFLGDTSGSANVTLDNTGGGSFTNAITVQAGNTGTPIINGNFSSPAYWGPITNNNPNLQLSGGQFAGGGALSLRGPFYGSAGLTIYNTNATPAPVAWNSDGSGYYGNIVISNTTLRFGSAVSAVSLPNSFIQVNPGATNDVQASSTIAGLNDLAGSGGTVVNNSSTGNRTLTVGGSGSYSFNGIILDGGAATATNGILSLTKSGSGTQTLGGVNTYSGATIINGGTLALAATGSINNTTNIALNAGGTFDVSAISAYTLSTNFNAAGTGLISGSTAAIIRGAAAGSVSFGPQTVALSFAPASLVGDATHPALVVSQGTLNVNGSVLVVTNASPLGAGDYLLITNTAAVITGSFASTNLSGLTLAPSTAATVVKTANAVTLQVVSTGPAPQPVITSTALVGGNLVFSGTNGTGIPGGNYYVISSTNLATPISGWSRVATNTYGAGGAFSVTNPVSPSTPQQFFMLEQ